MVLTLCNAALLAIVAVMCAALLPPGTGSLSSNRGPSSAFRAIPTDSVEFIFIDVFLVALICSILIYIPYRLWAAYAYNHQPPVVALRC